MQEDITFDKWIDLPEEEMVKYDLSKVVEIFDQRIKGSIIPDEQRQANMNNYLLFMVSASVLKRSIDLLKVVIDIGNNIVDCMPENSASQTYALGILAVACTAGNVLIASKDR